MGDASPLSGLTHSLRSLLSVNKGAELQADEAIRLQHYTVFLLLGIPTMVVFGIYNLWIGRYLLCLFILSSAIGLTVGMYLLRNTTHLHLIYQLNALLFAALLLYMLALGGDDGSKSLWSYVFPLICFFLLGRLEGLWWSSGLLLLALGIFFLPPGVIGQYAYSADFKIRFVLTYIIVSSVTYWFEYFRYRYRQAAEERQELLEKEKQRLNEQIEERQRAEKEKEAVIAELQRTLEEIQTLQGLVPICMHCKKIRDDVGFWQKIEQYIEARTEARFSHGLCPDCARTLYPDMKLGQKK